MEDDKEKRMQELSEEARAVTGAKLNLTTFKKNQKEKLKNQSRAQQEQSWNLLYVS